MTNKEPIGRFRFMNEQRVNLDGFATPAPELGLVAFNGLKDPKPSLTIRDNRIVEMDGRSESDFDSIDEFIARHGLDLGVAQEAMAIADMAGKAGNAKSRGDKRARPNFSKVLDAKLGVPSRMVWEGGLKAIPDFQRELVPVVARVMYRSNQELMKVKR